MFLFFPLLIKIVCLYSKDSKKSMLEVIEQSISFHLSGVFDDRTLPVSRKGENYFCLLMF